jgi:arylsulfatase A-like enzyme
LYGDAIETLDWSAGAILASLRSASVEENTLVVFTSDNGPWHNLPSRMLQEGVERWDTGSKSLLRGAKGTTYEGGIRVPGIMRWPSAIKGRQVCMDIASTLDLFPTMAKAAGAEMPGDRKYDGFDLTPVLRSGSESPRSQFYYCLGKELEAVRDGAWKYRFSRGRNEQQREGSAPRHELFHLDRDPGELYNVYEQNREVADKLATQLRTFAKEINADLPAA